MSSRWPLLCSSGVQAADRRTAAQRQLPHLARDGGALLGVLLQRGDVLPQREHAHGELALLERRLRRLHRLQLRPRRLRLHLCPLLSRLGRLCPSFRLLLCRLGRLQLLLQERRFRGNALQLSAHLGSVVGDGIDGQGGGSGGGGSGGGSRGVGGGGGGAGDRAECGRGGRG